MIKDLEYLYYVIIQAPAHTDNFSCNLSFLDIKITNNLKAKLQPIKYGELSPGNFLAYFESYYMILYKVVGLKNGSTVVIADQKKHFDVSYDVDKHNKVFYNSVSLDKQFYYKITLNDIRTVYMLMLNDVYKSGIRDNVYKPSVDFPIGNTSTKQDSIPQENGVEQENSSARKKPENNLLLNIVTCFMLNE
jgi:hypothetical protein